MFQDALYSALKVSVHRFQDRIGAPDTPRWNSVLFGGKFIHMPVLTLYSALKVSVHYKIKASLVSGHPVLSIKVFVHYNIKASLVSGLPVLNIKVSVHYNIKASLVSGHPVLSVEGVCVL